MRDMRAEATCNGLMLWGTPYIVLLTENSVQHTLPASAPRQFVLLLGQCASAYADNMQTESLVTSACVRFRASGLAEADCIALRGFTMVMICMGIYNIVQVY